MRLFPDYLLRAGSKNYPKYMSNHGVIIKDINSLDYSNYLTYKSIHKRKEIILIIIYYILIRLDRNLLQTNYYLKIKIFYLILHLKIGTHF